MVRTIAVLLDIVGLLPVIHLSIYTEACGG